MTIAIKKLAPTGPSIHSSLDEAVLHRIAGCDVVPFDADALTQGQDRHRGQLRAIVADHHGRAPAVGAYGVELANDAISQQRRMAHPRQHDQAAQLIGLSPARA